MAFVHVELTPRKSLHSNLVIFKSKYLLSDEYLRSFTFQSGYIQIKSCNLQLFFNATLHSNLVIFKSNTNLLLRFCYQFFTFQSGYIQMILRLLEVIQPWHFTFQSGYIQIKRSFQSSF